MTKPRRNESPFRFTLVSLLIAGAVLAVDVATPLGIAIPMLYIVLVVVGLWSPRPACPFVLAALATVLAAGGYYLSVPDGVPWIGAVNRTFAVFGVWVVAGFVWRQRRSDLALQRAHGELESRVAERTAELKMANELLLRDAEELEHQARSLRRSEAALNAAQRIAALGSWEWDIPGNTLRWSDQVYRLHELNPDHFVPTPWALVDLVHPMDRRLFDDALSRALAEGSRFDLQHRVALPGGPEKVVRQIGYVECGEAGEPVVVRGTIQDITELVRMENAARESEARLRGLMECVPDGIVTADEGGLIDSFNPAAEKIFGYKEEEVRGKNVQILMPEPYRSQHPKYIADFLRTGEAKIIGIGPRQAVGQGKDNLAFPIELDVGEMRTGQKRIFIAVIRDITQREETESKLRQAQKMEAIGQLTGGLAHDFNNLLTIVLGNLELLAERVGNGPGLDKLVETATNAALRGAQLTQHLLAFSRKQPLNLAPTDVNALVSRMAELLRRMLGDDVEVEVVLAGGLWPAMADAAQIENALLNLAINARDAMPEGGKLTIETSNAHLDRGYAANRVEVKAGQYVMIAVSDTGTGMTPEVIRRAFEPFFTTKETGKGSGLGLSMVYGFIKQLGGHISIYSEVGHGATIKLYLPKADAEAKQHVAYEPPQALMAGNETILVVEDNPDVRALVATSLASVGYHVFEAEDGPAALALLDIIPGIDLLLTDVMLPGGMNGRAVAEAVKQRYPQTKVLFISGYTENTIIHQGRLDRDTELLIKPFTRQDLTRRVRGVLDAEND